MKTVDVLPRIDAFDDFRLRLRKMPRQRQLHEDAVNAPAGIEPVNFGEKLLLARLFGQGDQSGEEAELLTGAFLVAHINLRGGILAHDDDGKTRHTSERRLQRLRRLLRFILDHSGKEFAFEQSGCHTFTSLAQS